MVNDSGVWAISSALARADRNSSDRWSICYEITLAYQKGRLELPCPPSQWFQEALEPSGIVIFPLTPEIACHAVKLSAIHKDPFDRLIIATALSYDARLASVDSLSPQYPELQGCLMA